MDTPALPPPTRDPEAAWAQLLEHGVARLENALPRATLERARSRVIVQARAERDRDIAWRDGGRNGGPGPNQRIWSLINKGEVFREIVLAAPLLDLVRRRFHATFGAQGDLYYRDLGEPLLSSCTANITAPGGAAMALHTDQMYAPLATAYPLTVNVLWMLSDFTEANGATRIVPGSHRFEDPAAYIRAGGGTVPAEGAAGTALLFDGRMLHGTGANRSDEHRYGLLNYYCQPFVRQQENYMLSLDPGIRETASPELLTLLGFRSWNTLGMVEGTRHGTVVSAADRVGELRPGPMPRRAAGA